MPSPCAGRTRRAILTRLYQDPTGAMWLRQLVRETGFGIGPVQRALAALMQARVIRRRARGNRVLFMANNASPLYADLRRKLAPKTGRR